MIVNVYPNICKKEIPLPNNPLKSLNIYFITSRDKNLIIDTGFNMSECRDALMEGIRETGIDLAKTDLLVTHLHSDHSGLMAELNNYGVRVYAGATEAELMISMTKIEFWEQFERNTLMFDMKNYNLSYKDHPGYKYFPNQEVDFVKLQEKDILDIGDYSFEVVDIPGHTPGQIGLFERKHKLFFGADHILEKISPNIGFWGFENDMLGIYFDSLKKIYEYDIEIVFSAHRNIIKNHKNRIIELLQHHETRLDEIKKIIKSDRKSVKNTASEMEWRLKYGGWDEFPSSQKWYAAVEVAAHLEFLFHNGIAERTIENEVLFYKIKDN